MKSGTVRGVAEYLVEVGTITYTLLYHVESGRMQLRDGEAVLYAVADLRTGRRKLESGVAEVDFIAGNGTIGARWLPGGETSEFRFSIGAIEGKLRQSAWMGVTKFESDVLAIEHRWSLKTAAPVATFRFAEEFEEEAAISLIGYLIAYNDNLSDPVA